MTQLTRSRWWKLEGSVVIKFNGHSKTAKSLAITTFGRLFNPSVELTGQILKKVDGK